LETLSKVLTQSIELIVLVLATFCLVLDMRFTSQRRMPPLRQTLQRTLAKITKSHLKSEKVLPFSCGKNRVQVHLCWHLKSFLQISQIDIDPSCNGL